MTHPDDKGIGEVDRIRLEEAGLKKAVESFPDDIRVAIATAVQVRQAFDSLPSAEPL